MKFINKKFTLLALSLTGGLLSALAWTSWCPGLILLIAFVPYLLIGHHLYLNQQKYIITSYFTAILPGFILFCIITLAWVRAANIPAAIAVIIEMSFLMSFILWLAHFVRVKAGNFAGITALVSFWLAFEYLSHHSVYLSPWVNLGNGLSKDILFIQWYEITGVAGGTLWILLSNLFLSLFLISLSEKKHEKKIYMFIWLAVVTIPPALSVLRFYTIDQPEYLQTEVVIVQPDIDPFTEKYTIPFMGQLNSALEMAGKSVTEKTGWLLLPETMVDDPVDEENPGDNEYLTKLREFACNYPGLNIVSGLVSLRAYPQSDEPPTKSARIIDDSGIYYDHFNSAFRIDTGNNPGIYHKSKLVPGIEMQFSPAIRKLAEKILPDMGGTIWGYGIQEDRTCFTHSITGQVIAPVICYESVFGNFVAGYVRNGAEALFIITNDGWWKNTNGYLHHLSYASLRAIETRRPVARCANTGISCFIDIRGKRTVETEWLTEDILKGTISSGTDTTFYVRYGDYISVVASILSVVILLYSLFSASAGNRNLSGKKK